MVYHLSMRLVGDGPDSKALDRSLKSQFEGLIVDAPGAVIDRD